MKPLCARQSAPLLVLGLFTIGISACTTPTETLHLNYPRGELSTQAIDFGDAAINNTVSRTIWYQNQGDLDMGISKISMGEVDKSTNFSFSFKASDIECPTQDDTGVSAKSMIFDSGDPPDDTGEITDPDDDDDDEIPDGLEFLLGPGCRIPIQVSFSPKEIGELWGSVMIHNKAEKVDEDDKSATPSYFSDPTHSYHVLYLTGEGTQGIQNIAVNPMRYDFGHVWTGNEKTAYFSMENLGDGTLTVQKPYLDENCDEEFTLSTHSFSGTLKADQSTYVELQFLPTDTNPAYCSIFVESDDEDSPIVDIDVQANVGQDPNNMPATVVIRQPQIGHQHFGKQPLEMELNIFDVNQPATSLICKVKSMVLAEAASVVQCTARDESGHVFVEIDPENLDDGVGIDTLRVQVTDSSQILSYASVPVLFNMAFPDSDDDGDGWGDEVDEYGNYDCNDMNKYTYPYAVEIADGEDNDCDGVSDEGTTAYDDDGDSYSEEEGDCNDYDVAIYPGARESADSKDNNCNGIIDENTSLYDDDGDGYTELNGDCDDENPESHPGAIEYCDGIDNDCDGLYDDHDNCINIYTKPYIVGDIKLQQTACEPGEQIVAYARVFDGDGQSIQYTWSGDEDLVLEPLTGSPTVTITCPEPTNSNGQIYGFSVFASDEDGNPVWDFGNIAVYPTKAGLYDYYTKIVRAEEKKALCSSVPLAPFATLSFFGLGLAIRRRKIR